MRAMYSTWWCTVHSSAGLNEQPDCWQKLEFPTVCTSYFPICFCGLFLSFDCVPLLLNTVIAAVLTDSVDIHVRPPKKPHSVFKLSGWILTEWYSARQTLLQDGCHVAQSQMHRAHFKCIVSFIYHMLLTFLCSRDYMQSSVWYQLYVCIYVWAHTVRAAILMSLYSAAGSRARLFHEPPSVSLLAADCEEKPQGPPVNGRKGKSSE